MAKRKQSPIKEVEAMKDDLPGVEVGAEVLEPSAVASEPEAESVTVAGSVQPQELKAENVSVIVPCLHGLGGYCRKRVDLTLTGMQAQTLKAIQQGLEQREAQLENGRFVQNPGDAVKWMLENANADGSPR